MISEATFLKGDMALRGQKDIVATSFVDKPFMVGNDNVFTRLYISWKLYFISIWDKLWGYELILFRAHLASQEDSLFDLWWGG